MVLPHGGWGHFLRIGEEAIAPFTFSAIFPWLSVTVGSRQALLVRCWNAMGSKTVKSSRHPREGFSGGTDGEVSSCDAGATGSIPR